MNILYDYALSFLGVPYKWGGSSPLDGLDCSGLCQLILKSVGEDPVGDQTAQGLFDYYSESGHGAFNSYSIGSLAFFGQDATHISHVAFVLDAYRMLEAGGGGRTTLTREDAIKVDARVRISLIKSRSDLVAVIRPYYRKIGMI